MNANFNQKKAVQLIAYFLKRLKGSASYLKLIKLAYLVDRESLKRRSISVTGDRFFSMKNGMLGSCLYDCFKDPSLNGGDSWRRHILKRGPYNIKLLKNPGTDALDAEEIDIADEIFEEFSKYDGFALGRLTHKFGEYVEVESGSEEVFEADILNAIARETPYMPKGDRLTFDKSVEKYTCIDHLINSL